MAIKKSELYSSIWASCDELRGGMDASQYKDYVLVLLFIKYVSDKYENDPDGIIEIPEGGSFKDMVALKHNKEIGDKMNTMRQGAFTKETPLNQLISELINYPEIDYDDNADLLNKLFLHALYYLGETIPDNRELPLLIRQYRKVISGKIYDQMKERFNISEPDYGTPNVLPFVKIEDWNFTVVSGYGYKDYRETVTPVSTIPKYVFRGFEKACHFEYKFDSKTEKDLAYILENDKQVVKWLRPAPNQFRIYWANNSRQYYPDFVVETGDCIYLVETKAADQMQAEDVLSKKAAALKYCKYATEFTTGNDGKP